MKPLISVIIPVYNVEKYIHKCVDSVLMQTYENLEIILVDDGSPDLCGKICDEYSQKDERVIVVHKENGGLSDAKNVGIDISKGALITFVDSDDWLSSHSIEYMYNLLVEHSADLVIGANLRIDDDTGCALESVTNYKDDNVIVLNRKNAIKDMMLNGCASWARLYKREIHQTVYFPVGEINEDEAIMLKVIHNCNRIVKTNKSVYNYRLRKNSITTSSWDIKKMDWYFHCRANVDFVANKYPICVEYAEYRLCNSIIWCLNNMTIDTKRYSKEIGCLRKELRIVLKKVIRSGLLGKKEIFRSYLLIYVYGLYAYVVRLLKKNYS